MFLEISRENQNIVHVHTHRPFINQLFENVVHHSLEGRWTVGETKEHNERFIEPAIGSEGSLPFVSSFNSNIIVSPAHVKLGEVLGVCCRNTVHDVWDKWEGVGIFNRDGIKFAIILNES